MMKNNLKKISGSCPNVTHISGSLDVEITSLCFDSRKVENGSLFFAVVGVENDGHQYISKAIDLGAVAIVCEQMPQQINPQITYIQVKNSSEALGYMADEFYEHPSRHLSLVGVTGTNGKTTTVTLLFNLFKSLNYKVGLLSTIQNKINDTVLASTHTTPDAIELNRLLRLMVDENCTHCFMEVSSHAIAQNRIAGVHFAGAVFSNISHDHLDYHKTFSEYIRVKKMFFDHLDTSAFALVNKDDKNGELMMQNTRAKKYTYSLRSMADFKCRIMEHSFLGLFLNLNNKEVFTRLVGEFNAYNLTAIYAVAVLLGEDSQTVLTALSLLTFAEGRFECIYSDNGSIVIVDYAHTPDALENVLSTIEQVREEGQKIITVVGAGGNRDAQKRPIMAKIASKHSHRLILTSDNPRNEDAALILEDLMSGVEVTERKRVISILDREEAIKTAVLMSDPKDIILIAGKGHEKYQEIKGVKYPFDDKEVVRKYINN